MADRMPSAIFDAMAPTSALVNKFPSINSYILQVDINKMPVRINVHPELQYSWCRSCWMSWLLGLCFNL